MKINTSIRPANYTDVPAIIRVMKRAIESARGSYPADVLRDLSNGVTEASIMNTINRGGANVAHVKGYVVGFAAVSHTTITDLYVDPAYAHRGVARDLYDSIEDAAREAHAPALHASAPSQVFPVFQTLGFKGVNRKVETRNTVQVPVIEMIKSLRV
jgi:N-acetylglutamate synthase-like GNAT family acetyltransferase